MESSERCVLTPPPPHTARPSQEHLLRFYHIDLFGGHVGHPRPPNCVTVPNPAQRVTAHPETTNVFVSPRRAGVRRRDDVQKKRGTVTYSFGVSPSHQLKPWRDRMERVKRSEYKRKRAEIRASARANGGERGGGDSGGGSSTRGASAPQQRRPDAASAPAAAAAGTVEATRGEDKDGRFEEGRGGGGSGE